MDFIFNSLSVLSRVQYLGYVINAGSYFPSFSTQEHNQEIISWLSKLLQKVYPRVSIYHLAIEKIIVLKDLLKMDYKEWKSFYLRRCYVVHYNVNLLGLQGIDLWGSSSDFTCHEE